MIKREAVFAMPPKSTQIISYPCAIRNTTSPHSSIKPSKLAVRFAFASDATIPQADTGTSAIRTPTKIKHKPGPRREPINIVLRHELPLPAATPSRTKRPRKVEFKLSSYTHLTTLTAHGRRGRGGRAGTLAEPGLKAMNASKEPSQTRGERA